MHEWIDGWIILQEPLRDIYTLFNIFYRKDGVNRLIRIYYRDGYFGFAEPLEFSSVMALIDYYREHSLQPYSPKLDITLMEPVSKFDTYDVDSDVPHGRNGKVVCNFIDSFPNTYTVDSFSCTYAIDLFQTSFL